MGIFTVQETKSRKKGKHSLENYVIFEAIRNKFGGGSMIGVHESLNPVLISSYEEDFELIVIQTKIGNKVIRFITGYGPQEGWDESDKLPFFIALDQEVGKAHLEGISVYISMDANSKLGPEYIPGDLHNMSKNGEVLSEIIEKNALIVANGLPDKSEGVVTRQRITEDGNIEKSTIDFVIISQDLEEFIEKVKIDEERHNVLTKVTKHKNGTTTKSEADHNVIETDLNIKWNKSVKKVRNVQSKKQNLSKKIQRNDK